LLKLRFDAQPEGGTDAPPEERAEEIGRGYGMALEALTERQPVVLALEDLHCADEATRRLAESLLELTDRVPLLVVATLRMDPASEGAKFRLRAHADFPHRVVELALEPLPEAAATALIEALTPGALDEAARDEIISRAEGNPLYLEELLRALKEGGGLERRRTWTLTVRSDALLPPALENLLVARIDLLPQGARQLAQIAAVIGREFPLSVLEELSGPDELETDLAVLLRAQVIQELRRYPDREYSFKHGLLQEAALSTLTPARRQELNAAVASAFEHVFAAALDEHLDLLAHYYAQSGNLEQALEYLERGAEAAADVDARLQASELWRRAAKVASRLGDDEARRRIEDRVGALAELPSQGTRRS
jgi:predicted ATPase